MAVTAKSLLEKRADLIADSRKILDTANEEDRPMNGEERQKWERMHKDIDDLRQRADDLHEQEVAGRIPDEELLEQVPGESRAEEKNKPPQTRKHDVSDAEFFSTWCLGQHADSRSVERCHEARLTLHNSTMDFRMHRPQGYKAPKSVAEAKRRQEAYYETRAMTGLQTTTTAGGFTVPDEAMLAIDVAMLQFGGMRQVSNVFQTDTGADLPIPTVNDTAQVGEIIGENTTATDQDATFGQLVLNSWKYSSKFLKVSIELLQDAQTNIPELMGRLAGERVGRIQNQHFTTGTGTGQPQGVTVAATDSTVNQAVAGTLEWDTELLALKHSVDPAYRAGAIWMLDDAEYQNMKEIQDSQGRPIWLPGLVGGAADTFDGDRVVINQDMPTGTGANGILYGDFSKYLIRDVLNPGFTVLRLDERFAELGQVAFLVFTRADGDLLDAGTGPIKYMDLA